MCSEDELVEVDDLCGSVEVECDNLAILVLDGEGLLEGRERTESDSLRGVLEV